MNSQAFGQTDQMIEMSSEHLSIQRISLYVLVMSRTYSRVNPHSIFDSISENSLLETGAIPEVEVAATGVETTTN